MAASRSAVRRDLLAVVLAVLLFGTAVAVGRHIEDTRATLHVSWPPLLASWHPHLGPGTPGALAVAVAVVAHGPALAARLPWRALVPAAWLAGMAWAWSLALVDGWRRGVADRLATRYEYLQAVDRFHDVGSALRDFTRHILLDSPHPWPAHVAGHPPGAVLTFVWLDHLGLGGGGWAAVWVLTVGGSAAGAALVALRALADEATARRAAPFLVLAPAAVWAGVSADGYFTAVAAWSLALLACAARRHRTGEGGRAARKAAALACAAGLLLGVAGALSYGLVLLALPVAGILLLAGTARPLPWLLAGTAVVPLALTLAGFPWWEAYQLLLVRYDQGVGGERPYGYWVWANLACTALVVGLATVTGLRRALAAVPGAVGRLVTAHRRSRPGTGTPGAPAPSRTLPGSAADRLAVLLLVALLTVLAADLSGMSKAETERIWLPFTLWLLPATALLPPATHRSWLAAQAVVALLVNHLLLTGW